MDKYMNNSLNRGSSTKLKKRVINTRTTEHYLMRGINNISNNNNNTSNIINNNLSSNASINAISNSKINICNNDSINDINNNMNNNKNNKNNNIGKQENMKKCSSIESVGFIEMELREAYNNPKLIQELNLNMTIPNLTLAILQAAITSTNGLSTLYHNSMIGNKTNNNKFYSFNNHCQCQIPDPSDLPIINHGNDPNYRDNDQPYCNEVDELLQELPDSSDMYNDIELKDDEMGFKDLKKLDLYISGLAKNLRIDDINNNFVITNDEILTRYSNDSLDDPRFMNKDSSKKDKIIKTINSKDSLLKLKKIYESKNIEFCKFSGYTSVAVTPLPNNVLPNDVISILLSNFKLKYKRRWKIYLTYIENIDIICDMFWLSFISWYKSYHKNDYDAMYSRLSYNYVKFISKLNDSDKNEFLVSYPLIMAHLNFLIYCECFPNSKSSFEAEEFKKRDCELVYTWFV
eukprot:jgi/Orpsp1_1/1175328/evm.model.c7180000053426.1